MGNKTQGSPTQALQACDGNSRWLNPLNFVVAACRPIIELKKEAHSVECPIIPLLQEPRAMSVLPQLLNRIERDRQRQPRQCSRTLSVHCLQIIDQCSLKNCQFRRERRNPLPHHIQHSHAHPFYFLFLMKDSKSTRLTRFYTYKAG